MMSECENSLGRNVDGNIDYEAYIRIIVGEHCVTHLTGAGWTATS